MAGAEADPRAALIKAEADRLRRRKAREEARAKYEAELEREAAVNRSEAEDEERTEAVRTDRRVAVSSLTDHRHRKERGIRCVSPT